jgi:ATP-binding cassette subfamily B protein
MTNAWPAEREAEAIAALAQASGMNPTETEEVFSTYTDLEHDLLCLGPGLLRVGDSDLLAILRRGSGRKLILVTPEGVRSVPAKAIRDAICAPLEEPHRLAIESFLERAQIPAERRQKARAILLRERLGNFRIRGMWILRLAPDSPLQRQLRFAGVPQRLAALIALHAIQYSLWIASWWILGAAVLSGHFDRSRFLAWALLLATLVPCRLWITWLQGTAAIIAGGVLKQRMFFGALRLHPDAIRHQGVGQLLGRVIESEAVESLALSGGLQATLALVDLALSALVLAFGGAGALMIPALLLVLCAVSALSALWLRRYRTWTAERLAMTHDLVENMIGHRTRLAQQPPEQWHTQEDSALAKYAAHSRALDRAMTWLSGMPRVWLVLALICLASSTSSRAVALGGALLAFRALRRLTASLSQVLAAYVAAGRVAPLFHARPETNLPVSREGLIVDARAVAFRYPGQAAAVLENCNLQIRPGERIVLEGASGGGKSTLASLLTGLRKVESGSLAVRAIAAAPQFHDNHVLAETFAFNALMARNRIPEPSDIAQAEALCRELGLGGLLERMPAGMLQLVGESGWQLSHGERSRLYIARALLQPSDLLILDESFAALDPENLKLVMDCVLRHAPAVLLIAHR